MWSGVTLTRPCVTGRAPGASDFLASLPRREGPCGDVRDLARVGQTSEVRAGGTLEQAAGDLSGSPTVRELCSDTPRPGGRKEGGTFCGSCGPAAINGSLGPGTRVPSPTRMAAGQVGGRVNVIMGSPDRRDRRDVRCYVIRKHIPNPEAVTKGGRTRRIPQDPWSIRQPGFLIRGGESRGFPRAPHGVVGFSGRSTIVGITLWRLRPSASLGRNGRLGLRRS